MGKDHIANRRDFAVIPIGGFNIQKTKNLLEGIETALGNKISRFVLLDKDFRSFGEVENICNDSKGIFGSLMVLDRKEIENYLLIPKAIERAIQKRLNSRSPIKPAQPSVSLDIMPYLESCIEEQHAHVLSQLLSENERFHREAKSSLHKSTINENFILQFAQHWKDIDFRISTIGGKKALADLNNIIELQCGCSVTPNTIINSAERSEIPKKIIELIDSLEIFRAS